VGVCVKEERESVVDPIFYGFVISHTSTYIQFTCDKIGVDLSFFGITLNIHIESGGR
jgi:hypothetical protein